MNFIGADQHIVLSAQFKQFFQFAFLEDPAEWIVRRAQHEHFDPAGFEFLFNVLIVECEEAVIVDHLGFIEPAAAVFDGGGKRRVERRGD